MKNIHALCRKIAKITDAELAEVEAMANKQAGYMHPLKMATASRVQGAGSHNHRVIAKLRELRDTILSPHAAVGPIRSDAAVHGVTCQKVAHLPGHGYEHDADSDIPYYVDGVSYCGRCHHFIP